MLLLLGCAERFLFIIYFGKPELLWQYAGEVALQYAGEVAGGGEVALHRVHTLSRS